MIMIEKELIEILSRNDFDLFNRSLLKYAKELYLEGSEKSLLQSDKLACLAYMLSDSENNAKIRNYLKYIDEKNSKVKKHENKISILKKDIESAYLSAKDIFLWMKENYHFTPDIWGSRLMRPGSNKLENSIEIWKIIDLIETNDTQEIDIENFYIKLIGELEFYKYFNIQPEEKKIFPVWSIKRGSYLEYVNKMKESDEIILRLKKVLSNLTEIKSVETDIYLLENKLNNEHPFELKSFALKYLSSALK
jgi:hypothetical protein